jgi:hypothetical protein
MTRKQHYLTPYVVVLEQKANKSNKYAVCRACIRILGKDAAYKERFTNTKKECARHFQNCPNFAAMYTPEQIKDLLDKAAKDGAKIASDKPAKKRSRTISADDLSDESDGDSDFEIDISNNQSSKQKEILIPIQNENTLDNYVFHPLTTSQVCKLEEFLLEITISCGFAFQWIENDAVKRLFHWLNPMITLPSRKVLGGRILKEATEKVSTTLFDNAKNDKLGVTLAFDGWKNVSRQHLLGVILITSSGEVVIWKAVDYGGKRGTGNDVVQTTEELFIELQQMNINVNGLITDSASENAAAR